jgi:hypothetical protein
MQKKCLKLRLFHGKRHATKGGLTLLRENGIWNAQLIF